MSKICKKLITLGCKNNLLYLGRDYNKFLKAEKGDLKTNLTV